MSEATWTRFAKRTNAKTKYARSMLQAQALFETLCLIYRLKQCRWHTHLQIDQVSGASCARCVCLLVCSLCPSGLQANVLDLTGRVHTITKVLWSKAMVWSTTIFAAAANSVCQKGNLYLSPDFIHSSSSICLFSTRATATISPLRSTV